MSKKTNQLKIIDKKKLCELKVHPGLKSFFGYSLHKSGLILRGMMENHPLLLENELSGLHCGILYILKTGAVANQLTLGTELGIDKATIVKIIDKLEDQKLVKRVVDPKDRRSKLVSLTEKGKKFLEKVRLMRSELEEKAFATFSKEDEAHLRRLAPLFLEAVMNLKAQE